MWPDVVSKNWVAIFKKDTSVTVSSGVLPQKPSPRLSRHRWASVGRDETTLPHPHSESSYKMLTNI